MSVPLHQVLDDPSSLAHDEQGGRHLGDLRILDHDPSVDGGEPAPSRPVRRTVLEARPRPLPGRRGDGQRRG